MRQLFTDESMITLYRADGRRRVYRRRGERFANACVVERDRFGGGSVMVWGGIAHGIKSQLIIVAGNMSAVRSPFPVEESRCTRERSSDRLALFVVCTNPRS